MIYFECLQHIKRLTAGTDLPRLISYDHLLQISPLFLWVWAPPGYLLLRPLLRVEGLLLNRCSMKCGDNITLGSNKEERSLLTPLQQKRTGKRTIFKLRMRVPLRLVLKSIHVRK